MIWNLSERRDPDHVRKIRDRFDRPLRDLRISVIDRCNFRCTYCMPREIYGKNYQFLDTKEFLSFAEIVRLVRIFAQLGVRKVRITGGEPLLRPLLHSLIRDVAAVPGVRDVGLITNGYHLAKLALRLKKAGLNRVTVSLDTLDDHTWKQINGSGFSVSSVLTGIEAALRVGFRPVKINAVVQRGVNDHQIMEMVRAFRDPVYRLRLIEYMDVGTLNQWRREDVVPSAEIRERIHAEYPIEPLEPLYAGEVADRYRYLDGAGEIGFISSVTEPFCYTCSRARLSADGKLFTCLFAQNGHDLRSLVRSGAPDDTIRDAIATIWSTHDDRYSVQRTGVSRASRVEMFHVGG